ncbi:endonuclease/exonuclease/phosphatase family protein [Echinicola shivajiensis]|uniref:endonuclease/exonuclease/phosphatase family protein n=1 Tax=Echinicola shivajiensis TaxID=1035916 RepID=UPI001BFCC96C|nr:endonuclease/exonuclease/phosphatase family protein [Echinicola shivajiensis]
MKIVTWNCNGAFRRKFEKILNYDADLYIIQECENPAETKDKSYQEWAENFLWTGDNKNKGLAIFAKPEIELQQLNWPNQYLDHDVKHFLPCKVNQEFDLLSVWAHRNNSPNFGYIGQIWKYLQINKEKLNTTIICGDFNSNAIWDEWDRWWNHSDVVNELKVVGIESYYHKFTGEQQGKETTPTLYFRKNLKSPYHIDYIFGPQEYSELLKKMEIGQANQWLGISDHMPVFCEF